MFVFLDVIFAGVGVVLIGQSLSRASYYAPNMSALAKEVVTEVVGLIEDLARLETCAEGPPTLGMTDVKIRTIVS